MLEARNGGGPIKAFPRPGIKGKTSPIKGVTTGLQNKTFHCEICDVHVNSETQLKQVSRRNVTFILYAGRIVFAHTIKPFSRAIVSLAAFYYFQHISSRRHKDRAAGKPPKPKYSPYNKLQRNTNALAVSECINIISMVTCMKKSLLQWLLKY